MSFVRVQPRESVGLGVQSWDDTALWDLYAWCVGYVGYALRQMKAW